ncbi:MAG TPA: hypothetical protein VFT75_09330 [Nocardioidaceae bacterium]|nr:hypothetical protein [Nocardioidaceae bacterium]
MEVAGFDVLLVTCAPLPDGEDGGTLLRDALAARGVPSRWVAWDDPSVAWAEAPLVAVRSPWDYVGRLGEFLAWAHQVGSATRLVNPAPVREWNTDKAYLLDLAASGLPVVPTRTARTTEELEQAVGLWGTTVVKPRVGASGQGVAVAEAGAPLPAPEPGPWVVQPLVGSIHDEGEISVFVLGGRVRSAVRKLPGAGEIRVHEEYGGRTVPVPVGSAEAELAGSAVRAAEQLFSAELPYARVDLMRWEGSLVVSELEVTESGLYLDVLPDNADAFAETVAGLLG